MNNNTLIFILPFFSCLTSFLLTPFVKNLGIKSGCIDYPNSRKQHNVPLVRIGGISIFIGAIIPIITSLYFINYLELQINKIYIFLIISSLIFTLGFIEDSKGVSPKKRLLIQFLVTSIAWLFGLKIEIEPFFLNWGFEINKDLSSFLSLIISCFFTVGTTNAMNWLDGLDGLASQISLVILSSLLALSLSFGNQGEIVILCITMIGAIIAFLYQNQYPSKIHMGDCGSNFIGFTLASISIFLSKNILILESEKTILQAYAPFFLLSVPLIDMFLVIISRILKKTSPFKPDRSHLHFRMLALGFSYTKTVNLITLICASVSLIIFYFLNFNIILLIKIFAIILIFKIFLSRRLIEKIFY